MNSIFSDLIIIESLEIYEPEFFLDINIKGIIKIPIKKNL